MENFWTDYSSYKNINSSRGIQLPEQQLKQHSHRYQQIYLKDQQQHQIQVQEQHRLQQQQIILQQKILQLQRSEKKLFLPDKIRANFR